MPGSTDTTTTRVLLLLVSVLSSLVAARVGGPGWLWNLDLPKIDYPLAVLFHDALMAGHLPLWSDLLGLGFPLYAEGQIGAFYPPNWLLFRLDPATALDAVRVLHLALAGIGTGLVSLALTGSRPGALLAAVVAALSGGIATKLEWTNVVEAYAWAPWVLLPLVRRPAPTRSGLVLAATTWGVQALAGHPNTWALTGAAAAVVLVASSPRLASVARALAFAVLGFAVGAVQILPTLLLTTLSVRSAGLSRDDIFTSSTTAADPLLFPFANAFVRTAGSGWDTATIWYPNMPFGLLEAGAYVGIPVLCLAAIGATSRRARPFLALAAVMLAYPAVAAFRPEWWSALPVLNGLRGPVRSYMFVDLALAILAAIGIARLGRARHAARRAALVTAVALGTYGAVLLVATHLPSTFEGLLRDLKWQPGMSGDAAAASRQSAVAALTAPFPVLAEAAIATLFVALCGIAGRLRVAGVAAGLAMLPLLLFSPAANQLRPLGELSYAQNPLERALTAARPHRVLTIGEPGWYSGVGDQFAAAGIPSARMFSSLDLDATRRAVAILERSADARRAAGIDVVVTFDTPCPGTRLAYVDMDHAYVCRVPDALAPPYWLPTAAVRIEGPPTGSSWSPQPAAIDAAAAAPGAREVVTARAPTGAVTVAVPADGWLYMDRAWWPDWHVRVDGEPATPLSALGGELIPVTAGIHEVSAAFFPDLAALGLAFGAAAFALAAAWALRSQRRPRLSPRPAPGAALPMPRAR